MKTNAKDRSIEAVLAENALLREEVQVARRASDITAQLVVEQFVKMEDLLRMIVLTKADKLKPGALKMVEAEVKAAIAKRPAAYPEIIVTSAATGGGIEPLRAEIAVLVATRPTETAPLN